MMGERRTAYGVDVGATVIKVGLVDESWRVLWRSSLPTDADRGPEAILDGVVQVLAGAGFPTCEVRGIGLGLPGLVDSDRGTAGGATHLVGWEGFPVARYLSDKLGIDSRIDHDLRVVTRGEMLCGAARGLHNFVLAALGTGIGICIVIDGVIYRRSTGDMGHMTIDCEGRKCPCGGLGCLERYVSGPALEEEIGRAVGGGHLERTMSPAELAAKARSGETRAKAIFDRVGRYLGFGMLNVVALVNPEVFIIAGGLARAGELLLEPAIEVLERHARTFFPDARQRVKLAQLGDDAGVIGAASLILDRGV